MEIIARLDLFLRLEKFQSGAGIFCEPSPDFSHSKQYANDNTLPSTSRPAPCAHQCE
jgi:hypothetical protein